MNVTNVPNFITKYKSKKGADHTHTRIGNPELNVSGGTFNIQKGIDSFYEEYYKHIFKKNKQEY